MKKLYEENSVQDIADAIREKGVNGVFKVAEMADAIRNIPSGGSGDMSEDYLLGHSIAVFDDQSAFELGNRLTAMPVTKVSLPNMTSASSNEFFQCTLLEIVNLPNCHYGSDTMFGNCSSLKKVILRDIGNTMVLSPLFDSAKSTLEYLKVQEGVPDLTSFDGFTKLETVITRSASTVSSDGTAHTNPVKILDLGKNGDSGGSFAVGTFLALPNLETLILRASTGVWMNFDKTNLSSNVKVYVPQAYVYLYEGKESAAPDFGFSQCTILPIEGSEFEEE